MTKNGGKKPSDDFPKVNDCFKKSTKLWLFHFVINLSDTFLTFLSDGIGSNPGSLA